jgi:soluble lytic murein transglycosylase-like protein
MRRSPYAFALVVVAVPVLSGPALARQHSYHRHHAARLSYAARHARPVLADSFAPGTYDYAPALASRQDNRQRSWNESNQAWNNSGRGNFGQSNFAAGGFGQYDELRGMAAAQASANGVPASLVERVIKRESGGNPRAVSRGNYGLMQIRLGTARAMGFSGSAAELLDPQVNMTYAVRYLAGAYRAANGNESRAVALYASGYHDQAKAQGFSPYASPPWSSGFAAYQAGGFQMAEAYDNSAPVYRLRHRRHHAV